jgi:hypothetical protein
MAMTRNFQSLDILLEFRIDQKLQIHQVIPKISKSREIAI